MLSRTSLPDQVFHRLVSDVLAGRFAPGERLPTQRALAAELGVNMASVREGVKRLEQLGLVEVRHGDAMRVRDWRLHGGPDVLVHLIAREGALDVEMLRSVLEARRLLLTESARLAASRRSPEQAELLSSLAEQLPAGLLPDRLDHDANRILWIDEAEGHVGRSSPPKGTGREAR